VSFYVRNFAKALPVQLGPSEAYEGMARVAAKDYMPEMASRPANPYTVGSGNVFKDPGVARPAEALAKAELVLQIATAIKNAKLGQEAAARRVGLDQPKISRLLQGNAKGFSTERLFKILNALGRNIEIKVVNSGQPTGEIRVEPLPPAPTALALPAYAVAQRLREMKESGGSLSVRRRTAKKSAPRRVTGKKSSRRRSRR